MPTDAEHAERVKQSAREILDAINDARRDGLHVEFSISVSAGTVDTIDVDRLGTIRVFRSVYDSKRDGPVRPPRPPSGPPVP